MSKAERALASARVLLSVDDTDGACNRAYYAMFVLAHAALLHFHGPDVSRPKTHNGLIAIFGQLLVNTGFLAPEHGRALNQVEHLRLMADYIDEPVSRENAQWAIDKAECLLAEVKACIGQ
ncbi:MAG TPA: DNA-binding protein [Alphaproteobacteria bacterium]|nr:DNA-binding protein [Alphaproteobacteria bacterium]HAJ48126.1 DNA-binding protein [Alphaproteobacteria bacterium]